MLAVLAVLVRRRRKKKLFRLGLADAVTALMTGKEIVEDETRHRRRMRPPKAAAPKAAASKAAKAAKGPDNLRLIKGLGPKLNTMLNDLGVTRFDQIAGLDAKAVAALDAKLGTFVGRITRDNFVDQAGLLAKDDVAGFEAKYGKLDGSL